MDNRSTVGVLGLGYLGKVLMNSHAWFSNSWVSSHYENIPARFGNSFPMFHFQWENKNTWENIPDLKVPVVITIPPVFKNLAEEQSRLREWCGWMESNRNQVTRVVYLSTTGVYPNRAGTWREVDSITPDTNQGQLRLETESILSSSFDTTILRAGAIYGPNRHIGKRILEGKSIPRGKQPVHRIHVADLANITTMALLDWEFPRIVNVVDLDNSPSEEVARWVVKSNFYRKSSPLSFEKGYHSRKKMSQNPDRIVSNQILIHTIGYKLQYPTFKEGLKQAINES